VADDQFTAEIENLCRIRRERYDLSRFLRHVRKVILELGSIQEERMIRRWVNQDVAKMYDDLERCIGLFDNSLGRHLGEGPTVKRLEPGESLFKTLEFKIDREGNAKPVDPDPRPIKGPGRRYSASSMRSVQNVLDSIAREEKRNQQGGA